MTLSPFWVYTLIPIIVLVLEILFFIFFCRIHTPEYREKVTKVMGWILGIVVGVNAVWAALFMPQVWVADTTHSATHKYVVVASGEYSGLKWGRTYIYNKTDEPIYYVVMYFGTNPNLLPEPTYDEIEAGESFVVTKKIETAFRPIPTTIRVKESSSSICRAYLLNFDQMEAELNGY